MITYWQFLRWHSTGQDTTPPASKTEGGNGEPFPISAFCPFLRPSTQSPSPPLRLPPTNPPSANLLIKSRSLLFDPHELLQGPVAPRGLEVGSHVSPLHSIKCTSRSTARPIGCHDIYAIVPNGRAQQSHMAFSYTSINGTLHQDKQAAVQVSSSEIQHFFKSS